MSYAPGNRAIYLAIGVNTQGIKEVLGLWSAPSVEEASVARDAFALKWDAPYSQIAKSWRNNWARVMAFFAYAPQIRKVIYTTNAIQSVIFSLRKITQARASFPTDEAAIKLLYLALRNIRKRWTMPILNWKQAMSQLMIRFETQFNPA